MIDRRKFLAVTGALGVSGAAGCLSGDDDDGGNGNGNGNGGNGGNGNGNGNGGNGGGNQVQRVGVSSYVTGGAWIQAFWEAGEFYAEDHGIEWNLVDNTESVEEMNQSIRQFVNQGMDGIIAAVWQADAANNAIEEAVDEGIPVFTVDGDATSPDVTMHVGFNNARAGAVAGEELYSRLQEQKPDQDEYTVLNLRGPLAGDVANDRNDGFEEQTGEYDDVSIEQTINAEHARDIAQTRVLEWLNANDAPDAIHSSNQEMALGAVSALDRQGHLHERGEDDHVLISTIDAGPEVLDAIDDGHIDVAVDQPNYFYMPIALHYMQQWYEDGDDAIPEIGEEITADDLEIPVAEHMGVDLWSDPIWAPAEIVDAYGHPRFRTEGIVVDETNTDEESLWGNLWG